MADPAAPTATPASPGWHRYTTARPAGSEPADAVTYGADLPSEAELRLLGPVDGRRILDLGCGAGRNAVILAAQGAKVVGVDPSAAHLTEARERADAAEVRVELHQSELADLAILRSDSTDAALSVMALATADDLARVFRQVHRVLRPEAPLVAAFPHPAFAMFDPVAADPLRVARSYHDAGLRTWELDQGDVVDHPRTMAELFTTLSRGGFRVDQVLEPVAPARRKKAVADDAWADLSAIVPSALIVRARKQGN